MAKGIGILYKRLLLPSDKRNNSAVINTRSVYDQFFSIKLKNNIVYFRVFVYKNINNSLMCADTVLSVL